MTIHNTSVANPSPGHYDSNTTGGYGTGNNRFYDPDNRIGPQTYPYNPVSEMEKQLHQDDLENFKKRKKTKLKNKSKPRNKNKKKAKASIKLQNKLSTCIGVYHANDSMAKKDKFSFNGLDNTSAHLGLSASHKRQGDLIKEFVRESLLSEISASFHIKKTLGDPYPKHNAIGSMGATNGGGHIKSQGYTNLSSKSNVIIQSHDYEEEEPENMALPKDNNSSTSDALDDYFDEVDSGENNLKKHQKNIIKQYC